MNRPAIKPAYQAGVEKRLKLDNGEDIARINFIRTDIFRHFVIAFEHVGKRLLIADNAIHGVAVNDFILHFRSFPNNVAIHENRSLLAPCLHS